MDAHEGCELSLARLLSDKFTIDSGGKTPQSRKSESFARRFSARMVPHALSFDEADAFGSSPYDRAAKGGFPIGASEASVSLDPPDLRRSSFCDSASGKTPSKFSVVRNSLSPYAIPGRTSKPFGDAPLHDYASRDSGFENSSSFENHMKYSDSAARVVSEPSARFDFLTEESEGRFEIDGTFCESSASGSRLPPRSFSSDFEFDALHDLEEEFDGTLEPSCSKYEIISTDSPDICSSGKVGPIIVRNFEFGSPIGDSETSENFGEIPKATRRMPARSETTRMLNFDTDAVSPSFKFIQPRMLPPKRTEFQSSPPNADPGKKSLYDFFSLKTKLITEERVEVKSPLVRKLDDLDEESLGEGNFKKKLRTDSGIEVDSPSFVSPLRCSGDGFDGPRTGLGTPFEIKRLRLFDCVSASSTESGCVSEMDECMFEADDDYKDGEEDGPLTVPSSFESLISGKIVIDSTPDGKIEKKQNSNGRPPLRRCLSLQIDGADKARTSLFQSPGRARKRTENGINGNALLKRRRNHIVQGIEESTLRRPLLQRTISDNEATIKMALTRAYNEPGLIGDFTRPFCLPLEESRHQDLKAISSNTLATLIDGGYKDIVDSFKVIDCRYPYEYDGGHIVGARNLFTEKQIEKELLSFPLSIIKKTSSQRNILVFHCEFSLERGPKLCRFLRQADRALNDYPSLIYPELYILCGGYHSFHGQHAHLCRPVAGGYTSMSDPQHAPALRLHRSAASRRALL